MSAADAVEMNNLEMASLSGDTQRSLRALLPPTGTSVRNPIDVGLGASFDLSLYRGTLDILIEDPGVDCLVVLGGSATDELSEQYVQGLIQRKHASGKDIIATAYPGFIQKREVLEPLYESGVPVYPTPESAIRAYSRAVGFQRFRAGISGAGVQA